MKKNKFEFIIDSEFQSQIPASERTVSAASSGDYQQPVKCFSKICLMKKHWR